MKPKLLVVECWGVGDLAIATPFLRAASARYEVTLLAKPYALDLQARFWPEVKVVPFVLPWTAFRHKYRLGSWPWLELIGLTRRLRKEHFAAGLSARWDPRDHALLWVVGARQRLGLPRAGSEWLLTHPIARPGPQAHQYESWRALAKELGFTLPPREEAMPASPRQSRTILMHTGAAQPVRVWALSRYQALARELRTAGHVVQIACDANQRLWWLTAGERDVATPANVRELMSSLDGAACFVGNDSGPGHLAATCGLPTFSLFGPQLPSRFAPLHRDATWLEGWNCPHRPCRDYCCFPVPYCLANLDLAEVRRAVFGFVAKHVAGSPAPAISAPARTAAPPLSTLPPEPRRVLFVNNTADLYGASRMLLRLVMSMDRQAFLPLAVLPEDGPLRQLLEAEGVEVILHPRLTYITRPVFHSWRLVPFVLNFPISVAYLWGLIRRRRVKLVHTNTGVILSPALAAWLARVPHLWHIREWFQEYESVWNFFSWYIRTFACKIIAISNAVAGQFEPRDKVVVIHDAFSCAEMPVPRARLRAEFRARHGLDGHFVVGVVGRIKFVRKGQEVLVQAAALLKQRGLPIRALVVGAPFPGNEAHLDQLQKLVRELGVTEEVVFTGEMADPRPAYAGMDALAMTSAQPEPFGGVVSEAMSLGLPVIATNIGGSLDQVVDGDTGLLVPPADAAALANAIERLRGDTQLCERMGLAAVERMKTCFSADRMASKMAPLFNTANQ